MFRPEGWNRRILLDLPPLDKALMRRFPFAFSWCIFNFAHESRPL
jgi:hypothetical protein